MNEVHPFHGTFTLERLFKATPTRVFTAFRDLEVKRRWFVAPSDYEESERSLDFRIGGREVLKGRFGSDVTTSYVGTFYDIVDNFRVVYAYDLLINDLRFSVTLATVQLKAEGNATRLLFTEQNTYLHAPADADALRQRGIGTHLDNIAKIL